MESLRATNLTTTTQSLIKLIPLKALFYEKYFHSQFGLNVRFQHAKNYSVKINIGDKLRSLQNYHYLNILKYHENKFLSKKLFSQAVG